MTRTSKFLVYRRLFAPKDERWVGKWWVKYSHGLSGGSGKVYGPSPENVREQLQIAIDSS